MKQGLNIGKAWINKKLDVSEAWLSFSTNLWFGTHALLSVIAHVHTRCPPYSASRFGACFLAMNEKFPHQIHWGVEYFVFIPAVKKNPIKIKTIWSFYKILNKFRSEFICLMNIQCHKVWGHLSEFVRFRRWLSVHTYCPPYSALGFGGWNYLPLSFWPSIIYLKYSDHAHLYNSAYNVWAVRWAVCVRFIEQRTHSLKLLMKKSPPVLCPVCHRACSYLLCSLWGTDLHQ